MKTITIFILVFLSIPIFIFSQESPNTVEFKYDDAGNRILRHAIYVPPFKNSDNRDNSNKDSENTKVIAADSVVINNILVSIYPNPTLGKFKVRYNNLNDEDDVKYSLFSLTGQLIIEGQVYSAITEIDLQRYDNGPYLFRLIINGKSKSWRIIKR